MAILAAFAANLGIAIAKFVGFTFTGSVSLLAEAIHSLADTINQGLLLLGRRRSIRAATELHPFGYGAERYFWAFVVALLLFGVGGMFSFVEGVDKLRYPHHPESLPWALGILGVAIVLESLSLRTAVVESRAARGDMSWRQFIRRTKSPELPVLLLEDTGALVGLVIAIVGVVCASATGDGRFDAMGSVGIGLLLMLTAGVLAREMKSLLIGESADRATLAQIQSILLEMDGIIAVTALRTLLLGPDEIFVDASVVAEGDDLHRHDIMERAEQLVRARIPAVKLIDLNESEMGPTP